MRADQFTSAPGALKSEPSGDKEYEVCNPRARCSYKDLSQKFRLNKRDFSKQFCHIYATRLARMKESLSKKAKEKWGSSVPIRKLVELQDDSGARCIIIGTLFKHQELKPSILKEISEEFQLVPQQKVTRFVSDEDELILEDELQRIRLLGDIAVNKTVTGIVCAVIGTEDDSGKFHVEDVCWAGPNSVPKPLKGISENRYLVLLSGLDLAHNAGIPLQMFLSWITGWMVEPDEQKNVSNIARVVIAGNLIRSSSEVADGKVTKTNIDSSASVLETVQLADDLLAELTGFVDVDLMPGEFDPTNYILPQQPMHNCMFPKASRYTTLHGATNPHSFTVEGRLVMGTSGQPLKDIAAYSDITDPLDGLEATLTWGHLIPTAPDTIPCYPYYDSDPFILEEQPDILFAGNQEKFLTKVVEIDHGLSGKHQTRLVCIPEFSKTKTCVVVNLDSLECEPVKFQVADLAMDVD